jgi:hypothetical protein
LLTTILWLGRPIVASAKEDKVVICHMPPGNPGNAHTITVSSNALMAHLAHGDTMGPCGGGGGGGPQ